MPSEEEFRRLAKQEISYDAWGRLRDPATHVAYAQGSEPALFLGRGYTGHEHLTWFGVVNMNFAVEREQDEKNLFSIMPSVSKEGEANARLYDPLLGRFLSPDPYVQDPDNTQNFNRYAYCLNNPLIYTDPDGEIAWFVPIIIGAVVGGTSGAIRAEQNGMDWYDGLWRGALTGAIGGTLSIIGGASMPFGVNLVLGTAEGAFTGGLDAALWGEDVGKGMLWGAAGGAFMTTITSENMSNLFRGEGFYTNENVFNKMMERGMGKQEILDYFGFEGKYDPSNPLFKTETGSTGAAITNPKTGEIFYNDGAFSYGYDRLKLDADHELIHSKNVLSGKFKGGKITDLIRNEEEWSTYLKNYKRQGLYLKHDEDIISRIIWYGLGAEKYDVSKNAYSTISTINIFTKKWWHFIYKIPRRY